MVSHQVADRVDRGTTELRRGMEEDPMPIGPAAQPRTATPTPWQYVYFGGWEAHLVEADGTTIGTLSAPENTTAHSSLASNVSRIVRSVNAHDDLVAALRDLTLRCDGEQGVRADGTNIDTLRAHAILGDLDAPGEVDGDGPETSGPSI